MEHTCRLCTINDTTLASISNYRLLAVDQEATVPLDDLIEQYLAISIHPTPFDPLICADCLKRIDEWHTFRENCHRHNRLFLEQSIAYEEVPRSDTPYEICFPEQETKREENAEEHKYNVVPKEEQIEEHIVVDEIHLQPGEENFIIVQDHLNCTPTETIAIVADQPTCSAITEQLPAAQRSEKEVSPPISSTEKRGRPKQTKESGDRLASNQQPGQQKRRHRTLPKICTICGVSRTDMAAHMRWHNNERPYQCPHCPKIFLNSSNLKNHINLHTRDKMYKCDLCDKEFPSTTGRSKHRETHTTERAHMCAVCGKSFKYRASLGRHKLIHFEEPKQKCTVCNMLFLTKTRLTKHLLVHMNDKPFSCDICGKAFNRKDNLKAHKKTHLTGRRSEKKEATVEERVKQVAPPARTACLYKFRSPAVIPLVIECGLFTNNFHSKILCWINGLQKHTLTMAFPSTRLYSLKIEPIGKRMHLNSKENTFQTPEEDDSCFEATIFNEASNYDIDGVANGSKAKRKKKRYYCTICGKHLHNIAEHRRMHLNVRTQQCPYCEKAFVYRSNLHAHLNVHTQERVYRCEKCDSEFSSIQGLKQHRAVHFERQHACTICNRMYSRKFYLTIHVQRVHTPKEQKHKCLICDREFNNETLKVEHMKIHEDSTLHECTECHRVYSAKRNLLRHIRTAHQVPQSPGG
ncbi:zinc finger protein 714-like [Anopheles stephensi]|uniref:zinc finger protein 714-like n=1 Tax=Anopheles stephensi TaxID=30069 RepID=UPI0016588306|nr:zinc finger protein 714-like [Anopheles stephensi]